MPESRKIRKFAVARVTKRYLEAGASARSCAPSHKLSLLLAVSRHCLQMTSRAERRVTRVNARRGQTNRPIKIPPARLDNSY
jgi:hypothetical protein